MIRKIRIENFMSLRDATIELDPFTVFWGQNGSGKSAIFKAIVTVSRLASDRFAPVRGEREFSIEAGVTLDDLVWRGDAGLPIRFKLWFEGDDPNRHPGYELEMRKARAGWSVTREEIRINGAHILVDEDNPFRHRTERKGTQTIMVPMRATLRSMVNQFVRDESAQTEIEPILANAERLGEAWRYRPSAYDIAAFTSTERYPESGGSRARERDRIPFVVTNGRGLALVLQDLQGTQRDVFEKIERKVRDIFPHVKSVGFEAGPQGKRLSFMTTRSNSLVPAPQEADGVLLATFLCWRLYTAVPPITICLEEPENGFYPDLLEARYELLRSFTDKEDPKPQILVATHSLEFLRILRSHHSEFPMVRAIEFNEYVGTAVESLGGFRDAANFLDHILEKESVLPSKWRRN
jgi:predicted ATPase